MAVGDSVHWAGVDTPGLPVDGYLPDGAAAVLVGVARRAAVATRAGAPAGTRCRAATTAVMRQTCTNTHYAAPVATYQHDIVYLGTVIQFAYPVYLPGIPRSRDSGL